MLREIIEAVEFLGTLGSLGGSSEGVEIPEHSLAHQKRRIQAAMPRAKRFEVVEGMRGLVSFDPVEDRFGVTSRAEGPLLFRRSDILKVERAGDSDLLLTVRADGRQQDVPLTFRKPKRAERWQRLFIGGRSRLLAYA